LLNCASFVNYAGVLAVTVSGRWWFRWFTVGLTTVKSYWLSNCRSVSDFCSLLHAAARLKFRLRWYEHVTAVLAILHWLRVPERIDNKQLVLMTFRALNGFAPPYMQVFRRVAGISYRRRHCSSASFSL
jgi:hypothetical protein